MCLEEQYEYVGNVVLDISFDEKPGGFFRHLWQRDCCGLNDRLIFMS